jgi:hypothetical protein
MAASPITMARRRRWGDSRSMPTAGLKTTRGAAAAVCRMTDVTTPAQATKRTLLTRRRLLAPTEPTEKARIADPAIPPRPAPPPTNPKRRFAWRAS